MPTLSRLLELKNDRLESIPDKFLSDVVKVQRDLLTHVTEILALFDQDRSGKFILNKKNLQLAGEIDLMLKEALGKTEYIEFVTEFAKEFNTQVKFNDEYFKVAFPGFTKSELGAQIVRNAQRNAVQILINTSVDAGFITPIKQQIELSVVNNSNFTETMASIQDLVVGNSEAEGKLLHYAKQVSHDAFAVADASYSAAVADEVGAAWYRYSGSKIETTRPFCLERIKRIFFCKKEIQMWGDGEKTKGMNWPQDGTWAGEMAGTDASTIFSTRGGYNCRHSIMAVSIVRVPREIVIEAIKNGYYKPTAFEKEELNLPD